MSGALARWPGSVAVGLSAAGPDEGEGFTILVVEEVGIDRSVEARIVQLDREIIAALGGALGPGGADLGAPNIDAVAGSVIVGPVGLGDDAHALGLDAEGDDFSLELVAGFLECANVSHKCSPCSLFFEPATIAASMAINRPEAIGAAPACRP